MTVTDKLFKTPSINETANQLADHMPQGRVWESKYIENSNLRGLVVACASPFNISQSFIELIANEFDINQTTLLIGEWEKSVGLPDDCIGELTDIAERRAAVIRRLNKTPIVNMAELQAYVDILFVGAGIVLKTGVEYYDFELSFESDFIGDVNTKFIIVAEIPATGETFEYDFELEFSGATNDEKLRCVLEEVLPSNVVLVITEAIDITVSELTWGDGSAITWGDGTGIG